jgi:hypothetical protein
MRFNMLISRDAARPVLRILEHYIYVRYNQFSLKRHLHRNYEANCSNMLNWTVLYVFGSV